jgi:hypothetical protein
LNPSPWNLAWHPRLHNRYARPDPARFAPAACSAGSPPRITGGLWTSPILKLPGRKVTAWSVEHDREGMNAHSRLAYEIAWPAPDRMAVIGSKQDLDGLYQRYRCRAHRSKSTWGSICGPWEDQDLPCHDEISWPPLDFAALAADYDALYLTEAGRDATWLTNPGTSAMACETVLWLQPVWHIIGKIRTGRWISGD